MAFHWLFLISVAAGLVGAMSGMGGGVVLIPALTLWGIDIKHAIAASMVSVIATSSGSAAAYVRDRITNLKVGMFLEMFTIVGALVGAAVTLASGHSSLFILFGVVLLASWDAVPRERKRGQAPFVRSTRRAVPAKVPVPLSVPQDRFSRWLDSKAAITIRPRTKRSSTARSGPTPADR